MCFLFEIIAFLYYNNGISFKNNHSLKKKGFDVYEYTKKNN